MARAKKWSTADIPDQHGRVAVATGANSGIGLHTALQLAARGAHVVVASRNEERGRGALDRIRRQVPDAEIELSLLDLADLGSIRRFAQDFLARGTPLDILVNNAGVMGVPVRQTTADGFELQFGTNHLGHFALTGLLLPALVHQPGARVVTVSSLNHWAGRMRFDDLHAERAYRPYRSYSASSSRTCCSSGSSTSVSRSPTRPPSRSGPTPAIRRRTFSGPAAASAGCPSRRARSPC
jgi:NAD(P)-dependent dehydrogenase (short-subunit alcohol dehydrogenase family)